MPMPKPMEKSKSYNKTKIFLLLFSLTLLPLHAVVLDPANSVCNGSIAECSQELEIMMESWEANRRVMEEKKYISYGALKKDRPVCNGGASGESYTKSGGCLPPPSNGYSRGCPKYYRCRGGDE